MKTETPARSSVDYPGLAKLEQLRQPWRKRSSNVAMERVCLRYGIRLLALFGSQTSGRAGKNSDIDIAFLSQPRRRVNPLRLYGDLVPIIGNDMLDLVSLNHASPLLAKNVACGGALVWAEDERIWNEFRVRALKEWDDSRKFEQYRARSLDRSLKEWGVS